jgi:hypothetical protein
VREHHCCCGSHNGAGSRTSVDQKFDQVMKASSMTPLDVQDGSFLPDTTKDIPYELQSSKRKGGGIDEEIFIPESTMNIIMDYPESAFVSTRKLADMEDALTCDGGATSTLIKSLENCTLVQQKVVDIQTAHGGILMSTTHRCLKTYYVRDRFGEIRPIVVKAYVVPGLKNDLLSVKGLNQSGYRVIHDEDEEESGVFAVINKKIDFSRL